MMLRAKGLSSEPPLYTREDAAVMPDEPPPRAVHYISFRDDRYWSAFRIWGGPWVIHRRWDARARRDIGEDDVVIFAEGDETQPLAQWNGDDLDEALL